MGATSAFRSRTNVQSGNLALVQADRVRRRKHCTQSAILRALTLPRTANPANLEDITDRYSEQLKNDLEYRREWTEKFGLGFVVPGVPQSSAVSIEQHAA